MEKKFTTNLLLQIKRRIFLLPLLLSFYLSPTTMEKEHDDDSEPDELQQQPHATLLQIRRFVDKTELLDKVVEAKLSATRSLVALLTATRTLHVFVLALNASKAAPGGGLIESFHAKDILMYCPPPHKNQSTASLESRPGVEQ